MRCKLSAPTAKHHPSKEHSSLPNSPGRPPLPHQHLPSAIPPSSTIRLAADRLGLGIEDIRGAMAREGVGFFDAVVVAARRRFADRIQQVGGIEAFERHRRQEAAAIAAATRPPRSPPPARPSPRTPPAHAGAATDRPIRPRDAATPTPPRERRKPPAAPARPPAAESGAAPARRGDGGRASTLPAARPAATVHAVAGDDTAGAGQGGPGTAAALVDAAAGEDMAGAGQGTAGSSAAAAVTAGHRSSPRPQPRKAATHRERSLPAAAAAGGMLAAAAAAAAARRTVYEMRGYGRGGGAPAAARAAARRLAHLPAAATDAVHPPRCSA